MTVVRLLLLVFQTVEAKEHLLRLSVTHTERKVEVRQLKYDSFVCYCWLLLCSKIVGIGYMWEKRESRYHWTYHTCQWGLGESRQLMRKGLGKYDLTAEERIKNMLWLSLSVVYRRSVLAMWSLNVKKAKFDWMSKLLQFPSMG